ncbi:Xaa-Pro aminopeptidase [Clostridium polyendosporum]|uniref:Xaa-Pro aminopeptidase n=1 Tax=Clostridium polyendosporum TaxID=69208 RepID=A0A919S0F3_9CLOT|nr:aminopeptidase P family protein [Clostridium polyendosporum]GIM29021.1 Xaa-Pro aminopeptidase [Clostridium polyendosporum]
MKKEVFINNRERLMMELEDNSVVILFAGTAPKKSADENYPFTPNRNFYYITGIDEEKHIVMLSKIDNTVEEIIFIQKPDPVMERWVGKTITEDEVKEISGIDKVKFLDEFHAALNQKLTGGKIDVVYLDLERNSFEQIETQSQRFASEVILRYPYTRIKNVYNYIVELRMIKVPEEVDEIRKAIKITIEAVKFLMKNMKIGVKECELEAYYDFYCKKNGVKDYAFKTIAAAGVNATILHYVDNNSIIKQDDLLLFDLGVQVNYYNADITRTFPASGKFTERQKAVYEAVLRVNEKIISKIKPGINFIDLNSMATDLIAEECIKLGLITDKKDVRNYYWHSIGHSLGLDTHDVGNRNTTLKPGMVFTIEPGIYIEEEGIGVRIEDDVLITEDCCEVLTKDMIKSVNDIEAFIVSK